MSKDSYVGSEHLEEFQPDFHDNLSRHWPVPRNQLHAGGWQETFRLAETLQLGEARHALDVCCGEGGSAIWLAKARGVRVTGVDIVRRAVQVAAADAKREAVTHLADFVCANIFWLPFVDSAFDVIYGQDPDGFAHVKREDAFREVLRVLQPGGLMGFHHWIPGPDAPPDLIETFDRANVESGYPSHGAVHADAYVEAMRTAGFQDVTVEDMSGVYREHMATIHQRARAAGDPDTWTALWLELSERHPFGVMFTARRPR